MGMGSGGPPGPLSWDGIRSFLSVHMWGIPRIMDRSAGLCPGLRYFVGEKLPGLGPFFGPIGLGPALCLSCLEAGSRAVPLGHVYPRRWLLAWASEAPLSSCLKAQLCLSLRGVARN